MIRFFIILACFFVLIDQGFAGSIRGVSQFSLDIPTTKDYHPGKFKNICGNKVINESLLLDNNGVLNVVVTLSGKKLKKIKRQTSKEYVIDQKGCKYNPHVLAMVNKSTLKILASDPTNHNIHTYSFDNDPINLMMTPGQEYEHEFEEPELVKVECDLHKWMSAWIVVTDNPFYAISGIEGKFEIKNVPPGQFKLTAWHETLGTMTKKITVGDGPTNVVLDFSGKRPKTIKN